VMSVRGGEFSENTVVCNDGNLCSVSGTCSSRVCGGVLMVCSDEDTCAVDSCIMVSCLHTPVASTECLMEFVQLTRPGTSTNCFDGSPCTTDYCDYVSGACARVNADMCCDDGSNCTVNDWCSGGGVQRTNLPVCLLRPLLRECLRRGYVELCQSWLYPVSEWHSASTPVSKYLDLHTGAEFELCLVPYNHTDSRTEFICCV
jgi:hypothetical protein